jgi:hypothetical protein
VAARECVEDEEANVMVSGTTMNVDDEIDSELAAMADAWLVRQGQRDAMARVTDQHDYTRLSKKIFHRGR